MPDKGLELLKALASQPMHAAKGMQIFLELSLKRPKKLYYLSALLHFCVHALEEVSSVQLILIIRKVCNDLGEFISLELLFKGSQSCCHFNFANI